MGVDPVNFLKPQFRIKDFSSTAGDYSFSCNDGSKNLYREIKMRSLGDMWGTGLFKANACDFCDDVATELADISLGDAWIEPYVSDGAGTNVIVTRPNVADEVLKVGVDCGDLNLEEIDEASFVFSQRGSCNHRHLGLGYRIIRLKDKREMCPHKEE